MNTLLRSFLDGSSSFLQVTRTTIKASMSLNFVCTPQLLRITLWAAMETMHFHIAKTGLFLR